MGEKVVHILQLCRLPGNNEFYNQVYNVICCSLLCVLLLLPISSVYRDWSPFCHSTSFEFDASSPCTGAPMDKIFHNMRGGRSSSSSVDQ